MESHASSVGFVVPSSTVEVHLEEDEPPPPPPRKPAPAVVIEDDDTKADEPAVIHDTEAMPAVIHDEVILLDRPRRSEAMAAAVAPPPADIAPVAEPVAPPAEEPPPRDENSQPILLVALKPKGGRKAKRTQLGIGQIGSLGPIPTQPTPSPSLDATSASTTGERDAIPAMVAEDEEAKTRRVETKPPTTSTLDDGWGPPGTTIPPPFLGAVVPADDPASGRIPVSGVEGDSAPLVITPPRPEAAPRPRAATGSAEAAETARVLEAAAIKLVETLRAFDHATSRDHVIAMLVDFVCETHHRVAFLAAKAGELTAFMQNPAPAGPQARLPLSAPSVFQDVVGTRLPYRGPISDPVSRELVRALFGSTTDDMMAVPVAVRERVVGVIYADGRQRLASDEHVTVAARAAGMALERLLKAKKS
jgi:hypothetical protein